jgi:hypothetical protein
LSNHSLTIPVTVLHPWQDTRAEARDQGKALLLRMKNKQKKKKSKKTKDAAAATPQVSL